MCHIPQMKRLTCHMIKVEILHVVHHERGGQPDERLWAARREFLHVNRGRQPDERLGAASKELMHGERGPSEHLWAARREVSTREKQPARSPTAVMRMAATHVAVRTVRRPKAAGAVASLSGLGRMDAHLRGQSTCVRPIKTEELVCSCPMKVNDWCSPLNRQQPP